MWPLATLPLSLLRASPSSCYFPVSGSLSLGPLRPDQHGPGSGISKELNPTPRHKLQTPLWAIIARAARARLWTSTHGVFIFHPRSHLHESDTEGSENSIEKGNSGLEWVLPMGFSYVCSSLSSLSSSYSRQEAGWREMACSYQLLKIYGRLLEMHSHAKEMECVHQPGSCTVSFGRMMR